MDSRIYDFIKKKNFYCVKEGNLKQMRDFWERLCKATEKAGLVKAVKIPYP